MGLIRFICFTYLCIIFLQNIVKTETMILEERFVTIRFLELVGAH
jgi:hypothetical protein